MAAAALTLGATAIILDAVAAPIQVPFWIGGSMAVAAILLIPVGVTRMWARFTLGLHCLTLAIGGAWLPTAVHLGPLHPVTGGWWILGTITATMLTAIAPGPHIRRDIPVAERMNTRAVAWRRRLTTIGQVQPATVRVRDWQVGDGYDVYGKFAPGGSHWQQLLPRRDQLESDADLPKDGNMEISGGATKRDYLIRVAIGANLDDPIPYPRRLIAPRSIHDRHEHGIYQNSEPITFAHARQNSAAVMAANGGGKSGTMHVWIGTYAMCVDTLVVIIDIKGGGELGQPWIRPWQEARSRGENPRPPIEAFANTADRAKTVIAFLRDLALHRPLWYADEKYAANSSDIPISATIPAWRVLIDEPKLLFAERPDIADDITELQEVTRSAGIRFDYSMLGGTYAYLPGAIQDQVKHQVVMEVHDKSDVGHFMDWQAAQAVDLEAIRDKPGMAYVKDADGIARRGRYFYMDTQGSIRDIALAAAEIRPEVDARAVELPSWEAYSRRWDWHDPTIPQEATVSIGRNRELYPDEQPYTHMVTPEQSRADMADIVARLDAYTGDVDTQTEPSFADVVAEMRLDPARTAVTEYLAENGASPTAEIIGHLEAETGLARTTLQGKISEMAESGLITKVRHGVYDL